MKTASQISLKIERTQCNIFFIQYTITLKCYKNNEHYYFYMTIHIINVRVVSSDRVIRSKHNYYNNIIP